MERHRCSRRRFLGAAGATATAGLAGCTGLGVVGETGIATDRLTAFHAGSLAPPFSALEPDFEAVTGVDVAREVKGSVGSTQKVTQQGRPADVLGVADYRLLRDRVLPAFGDWYAVFATNEMAVQYRPDAPGADDISTDNWWEVLARDDVTVGHSDPAVDPGGYRAVMVQQLGAIELDGRRLYDDATYRRLRANSTAPTGTETNLRTHLRGGSIDYAIYYRSIAETTDLPWVPLQPHVNLAEATDEYAAHYANATVETDAGTFTGAPIAYGITVPSVAESPDAGARWVERVATAPGRDALTAAGLEPTDPVVVPASHAAEVPERVREAASVRDALGSHSL
jgi:molybdate/tungstate transport system substrate-binding protein